MKKGHSKTNPLHTATHQAKEKSEHTDEKKEVKGSDVNEHGKVLLYEKKVHHLDGPGGNYRGL